MTDMALDSHRAPREVGGVPALGGVKLTLVLSGVVIVLMMVFGLTMKLAQGGLVTVEPVVFYRVMTAHGIGMVGAAGLTGAAIMWYFLARHVELTGWVYNAMLGLSLAGVVCILASIFVWGFAGAWTFLYPLPLQSGGVWEPTAAAMYLLGLMLVGVGFLLFYLETGRALIMRYGSLGRAMGWPLLVKGEQDDVPPPTVVASAVVTIFNGLGIVVGAAVIGISLINLYAPEFAIDALLAKNMIYFFGHVFINASIYMAVIAVYEIIPQYTGRPWKTSRMFVGAWAATLLFVLAVYPHHLLQDTAMPAWALVVGQVVSYASGIPLIAVTTFSLLVYLHRSGIRWDLASALLVTGVFGWSAGAIPAILDSMITVNKVMHNTLWVPGHFHFYLLLGEVAMVWGFMAWLTKERAGERLAGANAASYGVYLVGGLGFVILFLIAGASSVPRRWAVHEPAWMGFDQLSVAFAALAIVGATMFVVRFVRRAGAAP